MSSRVHVSLQAPGTVAVRCVPLLCAEICSCTSPVMSSVCLSNYPTITVIVVSSTAELESSKEHMCAVIILSALFFPYSLLTCVFLLLVSILNVHP